MGISSTILGFLVFMFLIILNFMHKLYTISLSNNAMKYSPFRAKWRPSTPQQNAKIKSIWSFSTNLTAGIPPSLRIDASWQREFVLWNSSNQGSSPVKRNAPPSSHTRVPTHTQKIYISYSYDLGMFCLSYCTILCSQTICLSIRSTIFINYFHASSHTI